MLQVVQHRTLTKAGPKPQAAAVTKEGGLHRGCCPDQPLIMHDVMQHKEHKPLWNDDD